VHLLQHEAQVLAGQILEDDVRRAVIEPDVERGDDVRMVHRRGDARFVEQALDGGSVVALPSEQPLHHDELSESAECLVRAQVDFRHSSSTDTRTDLVVAHVMYRPRRSGSPGANLRISKKGRKDV
jgi:hypothetical protein